MASNPPKVVDQLSAEQHIDTEKPHAQHAEQAQPSEHGKFNAGKVTAEDARLVTEAEHSLSLWQGIKPTVTPSSGLSWSLQLSSWKGTTPHSLDPSLPTLLSRKIRKGLRW